MSTTESATRSGERCGCHSCSQDATGKESFVYALGKLIPRFRSRGAEREFFQVMGRSELNGSTDQEAFRSTITNKTNRYLARQLSWIFYVENVETYLVFPRDPVDLELLVGTVRPAASSDDVDVLIGVAGPPASAGVGDGLKLPVVAFEQLYSFDRAALVASIPKPSELTDEQFSSAARELFSRVMHVSTNTGASDQDRALNYLAVRYPAIYAITAQQFGKNASLSSVEVRPSRLSGARKIMDAIFSFTHRETDVTERFAASVDVTEQFPFLSGKMSPYYEIHS